MVAVAVQEVVEGVVQRVVVENILRTISAAEPLPHRVDDLATQVDSEQVLFR